MVLHHSAVLQPETINVDISVLLPCPSLPPEFYFKSRNVLLRNYRPISMTNKVVNTGIRYFSDY